MLAHISQEIKTIRNLNLGALAEPQKQEKQSLLAETFVSRGITVILSKNFI